MKRTVALSISILTIAFGLIAAKPGKGIIATSVTAILRSETSQTLQRFELADSNHAPGLLTAAKHQAQRLQESVASLEDTDMTLWDSNDKSDFAAFLISLQPALDDLYDEAVFLGDTDLQTYFADSRQSLNTVVLHLKTSDPEFGTIYDSMNP